MPAENCTGKSGKKEIHTKGNGKVINQRQISIFPFHMCALLLTFQSKVKLTSQRFNLACVLKAPNAQY